MLKFYRAGESHGQALLAFVSDLPASFTVDLNFISHELHGRQLGYGRGGRQKLHLDVESDLRGAKKAHPAFVVSELDKVRESLLAHAVRIADDDSIPGTRRFYADDPWGNRLELLEANSSRQVSFR